MIVGQTAGSLELVMLPNSCPRCGKNAIVNGRGAVVPIDQYFQPFGVHWVDHLLRRFCRATDVRMPEPYRACLDCGLVWNHLHPGNRRKLREIVAREGITVPGKEPWPEIDW
jgi:hypothetical protein